MLGFRIPIRIWPADPDDGQSPIHTYAHISWDPEGSAQGDEFACLDLRLHGNDEDQAIVNIEWADLKEAFDAVARQTVDGRRRLNLPPERPEADE